MVAERLPKVLCGEGESTTSEQSLVAAFQAVDRQIFGAGEWGSAGCVCVTAVFDRARLWVANLGDCRAVICEGGQAVQLTRDHRAGAWEEEDARVRRAGGEVRNTVHDGKLAGGRMTMPGVGTMTQVTRAFGDYPLKRGAEVLRQGAALPMSNEPEVTPFELTEESQFLILACDGIWDVLTCDQAVSLCAAQRYRGPLSMAQALVKAALDGGSTDNCSVVVVDIVGASRAGRQTGDSAAPLLVTPAAHVEKRKRRPEDATTRVELGACTLLYPDLDGAVLKLLSDPAPGNPYTPGAVGGKLRKALQGFHALLPKLKAAFYGRSPDFPPPPRLSLFGLCDGHCGLRDAASADGAAAAFAARWLPVFVVLELYSLLLGPDGTPTPAAKGAGPHCFSGVKSQDVKARLQAAVEKVDEAWLEPADGGADGCSAVLSLLVGDNVYVASVGDSRAVLWKRKGESFKDHVLSGKEHRAKRKEEAERLKRSGVLVQKGLVFGQHDLTRSIGDRRMKRAAAAVEVRPQGWEDPPEALHAREERLRRLVRQGDGQQCMLNTPELFGYGLKGGDCFLLLATASVTDALSTREACEYLSARICEGSPAALPDLDTLEERGAAAVGDGAVLPPYTTPPSVSNLPRACRDLARIASGKRDAPAAAVVLCFGTLGA
eukprot:TRINITY_DN20165_c0_g1_i1.p1 TRINITY_DN20165_c0_g1~~TRINITY_DN20165_c0_g1_i1.p1  ORF type:complete len:661 (+),score=200.83 TRINITY_DN20165_c0_g1_i1:112-2094(+)